MEREGVLGVLLSLWLVIILACSSSTTRSMGEANMQVVREVLTAFKQGIEDPTGALASWDLSNDSSDPCSRRWQGLECDTSGRQRQRQLVKIDLHNRSLGGTVTPQLARLGGLLSLDLSQNALSGTLPFLPNLSSASSLLTLHLHSNAFSGPLTLPPSCFPRLSSLRVDVNSFSGSLPPQLPSCPSLLSLNLSSNHFTGTLFPSGLGNLTSTLVQLDASRNQLHGPIPPSLGNCSSLVFLNLAVNNLSGSIPSSIGLGCRNLSFLSFFQNNGSGRIPPEIGLLSKLTYLALGYNRFSGDFGLQLLANCSELTNLNLAENPITGKMPAHLGSWLPRLQALVSENTRYTGSIPASLGNCSDLEKLVIGLNYLSGTIPAALFRCQYLIQLVLQENAFTGSIPPQIGNLSSLELLDLHGNKFTGSLPKELGMLASIKVFDVENNSLSGYIPNHVFNCTTLLSLFLANNHISGILSSSVGDLGELELFKADNNMLGGVLPSELSHCTRLQHLQLNNNLFSGEIPDGAISNLSQITDFGVSRNNLSGPIPQGLAQMIHLLELDLSENKLYGSIPTTFGDCVSLQYLILSHNNLDGEIPSTLGKLQSLLALNLSHNSLSGHIPTELGNLDYLQYLDLSFNALSGTVPYTLAALRALLLLNFSYNNLGGAIPSSGIFGSLTSASFLGNPRLCGHIVNRPCSTARHGALKKVHKIGLAVAAVFIAIIVAGISAGYVFVRRRRRSTCSKLENWVYSPFLRLKLEDIEQATKNFTEHNIIGSGVTGTVYKGILADGKIVAFKRFKLDYTAIRSFFGELQSMGSVRHRNLVRILGYYTNQLDTNILILEYMSNGSLDDHLHGLDGGRLSWEVRRRVALAVAHGLVYLHYDCPTTVIHCDIKPKNILLDSDMEVRITDFGLAKVMATTCTSAFSDNMQGSLGYMAPELASYGHISRRCDVYSYGIVVMELISGRKPTEGVLLASQEGQEMINLVQWVRLMFEAGKIRDIVDARLKWEYADHENEIEQLLSLALQCTQEDPRRRPTMQNVVEMLLCLFIFH